MILRVLVCDDEPIAISRMVALLSRAADVEVVATALDGPAALVALESARPDLLFLDIEMPGPDGFEIVRSVERLVQDRKIPAPFVIFVTAYRRLAPEAFDSGVVDFLTKPVRAERLEQCLERARRLAAARQAEARVALLEQRFGALQAQRLGSENPHVWVQRRGGAVRVDLEAVERVSAEGPYVRLHAKEGSYLHREAMGAMETRLAPLNHLRVHRSHLVRVDQVARIRRTPNGGAELILRDGVQVPIGRSHAKEVRRRLLNLDGPA